MWMHPKKSKSKPLEKCVDSLCLSCHRLPAVIPLSCRDHDETCGLRLPWGKLVSWAKRDNPYTPCHLAAFSHPQLQHRRGSVGCAHTQTYPPSLQQAATTCCALWPEASLPPGYWKVITMSQVLRLRVGSASPTLHTQQPAYKLPAYWHKCSTATGWKKSLLWKQASSEFTHILLHVYSYFTMCFTHPLLWFYSQFMLGLLLLYSLCTHTFLCFTHTLLHNYQHYTPGLHTLYARFAHNLLWVFSYPSPCGLTFCSGFYSHLTPHLLTLYSRFSHTLHQVCSHFSPCCFSHNSFHVY